jgi:hypothetical protein
MIEMPEAVTVTTTIDERKAFWRRPRSRFVHHAGRVTFSAAGLALLSACASSSGPAVSGISTNYYLEHAAGNYRPPGPPSDPWGPYIRIAANHFDVPEPWIREVMRVESDGQEYMNGQLTVSYAGAMGLMQLEPETYQEMAARYGLGDDPFNPYDNIMAGTAYIHEMYQVYGSPGFLAAYNAGPGRLDKFMNGEEPLPDVTQEYVAEIAPNISGYYPSQRSEADQLALNTEPMGTATGLLPPGFSSAPLPSPDAPAPPAPVEVAAVEPSPQPDSAVYQPSAPALVADTGAPPAGQIMNPGDIPTRPDPAAAPNTLPSPPPQHFALIQSAMADTPPARDFSSSDTGWAISLGAYSTRENAKAALGIAELSAVVNLMHGEPVVERIDTGYSVKYRARFIGLPHIDAIDACHRLHGGPTSCTILSPDAQR